MANAVDVEIFPLHVWIRQISPMIWRRFSECKQPIKRRSRTQHSNSSPQNGPLSLMKRLLGVCLSEMVLSH